MEELNELITKATELASKTFGTSTEPYHLYNEVKQLAKRIALRKLNEVKSQALNNERHSDISWCDDAIKTVSEDETMFDKE
jgi:hypothetical protein